MKRIFFLLTFQVIFFSCSKDADDTDNELQDFTVTLNVDANHRFSRFHESIFAFLSDENGTILDSGELRLGETTTLSFSGATSVQYDLSYMRYDNIVDLGIKTYTLVTFTNIEQGTYDIGPTPLLENTNDEIYIYLTNTGYPCEVVASPAGRGTFGPENGGYYNWQANLEGSPTSDFYMAFKSPNDQFNRYLWLEDVDEGSVFNIDYNSLPAITNTVNTQIPSNDYSNFSVEGLSNDDENNIRHSIALGNFAGGNPSLSTSVPSNVFDYFLFNVHFKNDNTGYSKQLRTTTIPGEINTPTLNFAVNNPSSQNFNMTTTGDATIYDVIYRAGNIDETLFFSHTIYGEVLPEVTFSKQVLRQNVQQAYPVLVEFQTLPLGDVTLTYYSQTNSYTDILKYKIQGDYYEIPATNGFIDRISKQFD